MNWASILVAVDGHQGGLDAASLASVLAKPDSELAIGHVPLRDAGLAADAIRKTRAMLGRPDTRVLVARRHSVAIGLHELVDESGADLLVVGAHHHRHLDLRSRDHTRATLRDLPCAVAVAPHRYATRPDHAVGTVGVGFVDDPSGRIVLDVARGVAWQLGAEVRATTVVAPSNWTAADSGAGWRAAAAQLRMAEIPGVHGAAVEGVPLRALALISTRVDLLVVGARHHHVVRRLLVGEVAERLSHTSRCPLLVVPHPPT